MTDGTTLVAEQIADDERKYGKYATLAQLSDLLGRCRNLLADYLGDYYAADKQIAQPPPVASKLSAEAIGAAVVARACPTGVGAWAQRLADIVADEIRKALGKAGTTKEVDRPSLERRDKTIKRLDASIAGRDETILWLRQGIIEKDELIRGLRQDVKDLIAPPPRADDTATPHQCKWWSKTVCNHPHDGHNPCYWDDDTGRAVSDCKYFETKESKEESHPPPEVLSETDAGAMVGAISIYFLDHAEATIPQLAKLAQVSEERMLTYVMWADHLIYDMRPVVRLTPVCEPAAATAEGRPTVKMSVKDARAAKVCRICREPDTLIRLPDGTLDPFRYDFGAEYAHKSCLTPAAAETPQSPKGA